MPPFYGTLGPVARAGLAMRNRLGVPSAPANYPIRTPAVPMHGSGAQANMPATGYAMPTVPSGPGALGGSVPSVGAAAGGGMSALQPQLLDQLTALAQGFHRGQLPFSPYR